MLAFAHAVYSLTPDVIPTCKRVSYAIGYMELGLLYAAREELDCIPATESGDPGILVVRIELAMAEEEWSEVIRLAPLVVEADPRNERPWIAWGYALRERQQIREALEVLLRGELKITRPSVLVDYNLACYLALLGELKEARRRLNKVFARAPSWRAEAAADPDLSALNLSA